ncbi:MAG: EamA family transporter [Opitutae bacterium]|nr:EamA family transporter [Opitutae bacterium]
MSASAPPVARSALLTAFAAIYLVWGSTYLAIRVAVETMPPFLMAASRFLVSGALLYGFLWFTRRIRPTARQWFDNSVVGAFLMLGGNGLVCWAEQKVPSSMATLMVSVGPLVVVLLDWAVLVIWKDTKRGARPTLLTFTGLLLGIAGLTLLVGPDVLRGGGATGLDLLHVGALVLACVLWSTGSLVSRYAKNPAEPFTASALQMLTGSIWLFAMSVLMGEPAHFEFAAVTARSFWAWSYLTTVGSLVGFTAFVWLMKHSTPARVYTYTYVNPIVAVFLGWLLLHEPVGSRMLAASAVIIAGVALITAAKTKPAAQPAR